MPLDETHDPLRRSWVETANSASTDFPIQNLPFGVFRKRAGDSAPRAGVAIGDRVLDLTLAARVAGFQGLARAAAEAAAGATLNALAALGRPHWQALRLELSRSLASGADVSLRRALEPELFLAEELELLLPVAIGDYTDFYTSRFHAENVGKLFRPDQPLLPNYDWVPIGYHGRASSVVVSGTPIRRPRGQLKPDGATAPVFAPSACLDYEAELGFIVGPKSELGRPIPIREALDHVFGVVLLNDWSARDIQRWESQPLGPFLGKNFATTISPWVVTLDALEPFRVPARERQSTEPMPLAYLADDEQRKTAGFAIEIEMALASARMQTAGLLPAVLARSNYRDVHWTLAQLIGHHTSNGCDLRTGDLLGSGTISGATPDALGSLLELTRNGASAFELPSGEERRFIEDGDEVYERARCSASGAVPIGFGEARGLILPATDYPG